MPEDKDFQAANEIGKIYNSFVEKNLLCEFFLDSSLVFIQASRGFLFLSGTEDKLWLECSSDGLKQCPDHLQAEAEAAYRDGKQISKPPFLFVPLVVRNTAIGVACFEKTGENFSDKEVTLASDLSCHLASALKNILLFEQNLQMERLAAIGQTMGMVLHEIKNIIQLAKFAEEYIQLGIREDKKKFMEKGVEGIRKAIKEMDGFTYEVLSLTKNYKIQPEQVELKKVFMELHEDLIARASQYNVLLDFKVDPSLEIVEAESRSLYRTLLNLVKNAVEASDSDKPQSYVRVTASPKGEEMYEISVEDNGNGMSNEAKAKIFQAFFSTKGEKGTGLGLLVIDRTVKAHHGTIKVESEFGKGTKFILSLPKILPKT